MSNGKVERLFSQLKTIKTEKRSLLSKDHLDDLLLLNSDAVSLKDFNSDDAIDLWWRAKTRRPHQPLQRKPYKKRVLASCSSNPPSTSASIPPSTATSNPPDSESDMDSQEFCLPEQWDSIMPNFS